MEFTDLVVAGAVAELPGPAEEIPAADALAYQVRGEAEIRALEAFDGELPVIATDWQFEDERDEDADDAFQTLVAAAQTDAVAAVEIDHTVIESHESVLEELDALEVETILAYRDFDGTPDIRTLVSMIMELDDYGSLIYIETMAESPDDCLTVLRTFNEATESGVAVGGACMGDIGRHTRIVAPSYGSKLAYGSVDGTGIGTPGQFPLSELVELIQESEDPSIETSLHPKLASEQFTGGEE